MTQCIDVDQLVSLGAALEWDVEPRLVHIMSCEACVAQLRELQTVRAAMSQELDPRPGFSQDVLNALPVTRKGEPKAVGSIIAVANMLLAAITAFFAIALVASGDSGIEIGAPVLFVALIVGVTTFVRNALRTPVAI